MATIIKQIQTVLLMGLLYSLTVGSVSARPALIKRLEINNQTHLTYRVYPADNPVAIVLMIHGITSHSGWYTQTGEILSDHGYTVYAPDRRGSGLNLQDRGHVQNYEDLIADLDSFIARIRADFPNKPIYLMGISWGGKLALLYECLRPGEIAGVILSCPGIKPRIDLKPLEKLRVFYTHARSREKQPMIRIPIFRSDLFTDDIRWQNWIEQDPYALRRCTSRFFWESSRIDKALKRNIKNSQAPILLQLAGRDEIINNDKTLRFLSRKKGYAEGSVVLAEYPQARHTLEFEKNSRQIALDIVRWLRGREK